MSVTAQRALRAAIDDRQFARVYYLHGDDEYRKDEAITRLVAAAVDPATRDFNLDRFRGADTDAGALGAALASMPMLAERRVIVVRDVGGLKKAARVQLDRYLAAPAADAVVVLTSLAGDTPDPGIADAATTVPFPALDEQQLSGWVMRHARELGLELNDAQAATIVNAVGGDSAAAAGEIDKLASLVNGRAVTAADLRDIIGIRPGETVEALLNAVAARDGARAAALVDPVLAQPKVTAVQVIGNLSVQVLGMAAARAMVDAGVKPARVSGDLTGLLKTTRANVGRSWSAAVQCWTKYLPLWSAAELSRALEQLRDTDVALKDTRLSSDDGMLRSLVLALTTGTARTPRGPRARRAQGRSAA